VPYFYEQVGQRLRAYVAPPPPLRKAESTAEADERLEEVAEKAETAASNATDETQIGAAEQPLLRPSAGRVD